jgi:DNA primase
MMDNAKLVLGLLETCFGPGKKDKNGKDYTFSCPFCKHRKPKLVINVESGVYNCWTCHPPTKGRNLVYLLKKANAHPDHVREMKSYFSHGHQKEEIEEAQVVTLPKEFKPLYDNSDTSFDRKRAIAYLRSRNVNEDDIKKYNIGYCSFGRYQNRVIVPSYDHRNVINYFVARSMQKNSSAPYDAPSCTKSEIIGMENMINWSVPVILCEGAFDAIAIKRNALPLFGKTIPKAVMTKLVESTVKTVYLALDEDALKQSMDYAKQLLDYGKEVYLLDLKGKDPSVLGFEKMISLLHVAKPLSFSSLLSKKIQLL